MDYPELLMNNLDHSYDRLRTLCIVLYF